MLVQQATVSSGNRPALGDEGRSGAAVGAARLVVDVRKRHVVPDTGPVTLIEHTGQVGRQAQGQRNGPRFTQREELLARVKSPQRSVVRVGYPDTSPAPTGTCNAANLSTTSLVTAVPMLCEMK